MSESREQVTRLLQEIRTRPEAAAEMLPLVYEELRSLARARMAGERRDHTLRATALVHEAYLRLAGHDGPWHDRTHFFRAAAEAMRRILIDHARARGAEKRGGGAKSIQIEAISLGEEWDPTGLMMVDEALGGLAREDARAAEVVQLRFYAGLSFAEIAALLDCSERTVLREWAYARARLVQLIEAGEEGMEREQPRE